MLIISRFKANIPAVSTFRAKYASANMGSSSVIDEAKLDSPPPVPVHRRAPSGPEVNGIVHPNDDIIAEVLKARNEALLTRAPSDVDGDTMLME